MTVSCGIYLRKRIKEKEILTDIQYELKGELNPNREKLPMKIEQQIIDEYKNEIYE